jgi:tRNA pseudouridine32 synthase/23S rRNA pseudouridine746 synthase
MKRFVLRTAVRNGEQGTVCDFLSLKSGHSKGRVKDAMNKGAVWLRKKKGGLKRVRRAGALLSAGDRIEFYYDEKLLSLKPPEAICVADEERYSVWYKPAGLMAQGTQYGDHCSIMRQAELFFGPSREVFLVHRLDREVSGLMLLAHSRDAAARLSGLFQKNLIVKRYRAEVLGNPAGKGQSDRIELLLDGKPSVTEFEVESYDPERNTSTVNVVISTGRFHQIRRHFDMIGSPVIGDPRYGKGNKNREGMKLRAVSLKFICPFSKKEVEFKIPET